VEGDFWTLMLIIGLAPLAGVAIAIGINELVARALWR